MSYFERVNNLWTLLYLTIWTIPSFPGASNELVRKYAPEKPFVAVQVIVAQSVFWLIDSDILIDYPQPVMPNMAEIGGLSIKPSQPLSSELEKFIASAKGHVILV